MYTRDTRYGGPEVHTRQTTTNAHHGRILVIMEKVSSRRVGLQFSSRWVIFFTWQPASLTVKVLLGVSRSFGWRDEDLGPFLPVVQRILDRVVFVLVDHSTFGPR